MNQSIRTMSARLTYEDYCLIPNDGNRHEIIDGVHYMSPAPRVRHQLILGNLYLSIANFFERDPHWKCATSSYRCIVIES